MPVVQGGHFLSAASFFRENQFAFQQYQLKSNKYSRTKAIRTKPVHKISSLQLYLEK